MEYLDVAVIFVGGFAVGAYLIVNGYTITGIAIIVLSAVFAGWIAKQTEE